MLLGDVQWKNRAVFIGGNIMLWQYYGNIKLLHNFLYYINHYMKTIWHKINIMQQMLSTEIVLNKKQELYFKKEAV